MSKAAPTQNIELLGVVGLNGKIASGFLLHPGDNHVIYPLGSTIIVKSLADGSQIFLQKDGHTDVVTCLALSSSGKYLASGQRTLQGSLAPIIIWDMETFTAYKKLLVHKGGVQDLHFSPRERYLGSLGARDDNKVVVWDVSTGEAICGAPASLDSSVTIRWSNSRDDTFTTAGNYTLRNWNFSHAEKRLKSNEYNVGAFKRVFTSIAYDPTDEFIYAANKTGDILKCSGDFSLMKDIGPKKRPFSLGVSTVITTRDGDIIAGSGDGTVALLSKVDFNVLRKTQVAGNITSLALNAAGDHVFVATDKSNIYLLSLKTFEFDLRSTCHSAKVTAVAFPQGASDVFATSSSGDIRVWHARTRNELVRIVVPNLDCLCVIFAEDGKSIISGWNDGKIRAFKPQSGALLYVINDAHRDGVTVLAATRDCQALISGGVDGQIRVWSLGRTQKLVATMKEHRARINAINLNTENTLLASASDDGSCIVWNLTRYTRSVAVFASTQFKSVAFHPDSSQIISGGTDRKLTYWDVADGNPIRTIEGIPGSINTLAVAASGDFFMSGNNEKQVNFWHYDNGDVLFTGSGHSGAVSSVAISPDQRTIVSVGEEGGIFIWNVPAVDSESAALYDAAIEQLEQKTAASKALAGSKSLASAGGKGQTRRF